MDILEKNEVIKIMKELHIPHIYNSEKLIGYGGNQDWFEDEWAQKAGCASVLASNIIFLAKNSRLLLLELRMEMSISIVCSFSRTIAMLSEVSTRFGIDLLTE